MTTFQLPPPYVRTNLDEWARTVTDSVVAHSNGKTNNTGTVTLGANTTSTVVTLAAGRLGNDTIVLLSPTTASAATEFGAGSLYLSARDVDAKTFTLTHANTADTDKIFDYILVG